MISAVLHGSDMSAFPSFYFLNSLWTEPAGLVFFQHHKQFEITVPVFIYLFLNVWFNVLDKIQQRVPYKCFFI